jgi:hypothetical protein
MDNSRLVNHASQVIDLERAAQKTAAAQVEADMRIGLTTLAFPIEASVRPGQGGLICQGRATSQRLAGCARKAGNVFLQIEGVGKVAMKEASPVDVLPAALLARCGSPGEGPSGDTRPLAMRSVCGGHGEIPQ